MEKKPRILVSPPKGREKIYTDAVLNAGGIAEIPEGFFSIHDYDGFLLCGGSDINPAIYGQDINGAVNIDYERDEMEINITRSFMSLKKPILGICRGYQLLNAVFGGSLIQHLPNTDAHRSETDVDRVHDIELCHGSFLHKLYKKSVITVNSVHHQAIDKVGEGLIVTAFADGGKIPEAFQHESLPVYGVQFHPERLCCPKKAEETIDGLEIFKFFVDLCR